MKMLTSIALGVLVHIAGTLQASAIPGLYHTRVDTFGAALADDGNDPNCIDFRNAPLGSELNPWSYQGVPFFGTNFDGTPLPTLDVRTDGGFTGLNCGYGLEITWTNSSCDFIEITLVSFAQRAEVTTYDGTGAVLETKKMTAPQMTAETLHLHGQNVVKVVVIAPSNETLLLAICCVAADCLTVTTNADSGPGTLRAAIDCANNHPGLDTITFAIPGAGPHTIQPMSPLPTLTDPVVIDGLTQPGATPNTQSVGNNARLMIEVDGGLTSNNGFMVAAGSSTLRGLVINRFNGGVGILLSSSSNVVEGCFIGTDVSGTASLPNIYGIWMQDAALNRIGGQDPGSHNLISGNQYAGLYFAGQASSGNRIQGNYIGADATGLKALGNGTSLGNGAGIFLFQGDYNLIGGTNPGEGNLISGNKQSNFILSGSTNTIQGNFIGPDAIGAGALSSGYYGIVVGNNQNAVGNRLGWQHFRVFSCDRARLRGCAPLPLEYRCRFLRDCSGRRCSGAPLHPRSGESAPRNPLRRESFWTFSHSSLDGG